MGARVGCLESRRKPSRERFGEMEFRTGSVVIKCIDVFGVLIERDDRRVDDEDVSKSFETSGQLGLPRVEILDGVIENLSKECNESRFEPAVKRRIREFVTVSWIRPSGSSSATPNSLPVRSLRQRGSGDADG